MSNRAPGPWGLDEHALDCSDDVMWEAIRSAAAAFATIANNTREEHIKDFALREFRKLKALEKDGQAAYRALT